MAWPWRGAGGGAGHKQVAGIPLSSLFHWPRCPSLRWAHLLSGSSYLPPPSFTPFPRSSFRADTADKPSAFVFGGRATTGTDRPARAEPMSPTWGFRGLPGPWAPPAAPGSAQNLRARGRDGSKHSSCAHLHCRGLPARHTRGSRSSSPAFQSQRLDCIHRPIP